MGMGGWRALQARGAGGVGTGGQTQRANDGEQSARLRSALSCATVSEKCALKVFVTNVGGSVRCPTMHRSCLYVV